MSPEGRISIPANHPNHCYVLQVRWLFFLKMEVNPQRPDGSILDPSVFNGNFQHENGVLGKNNFQDRPLKFHCASDETNFLLLAWPQSGQNVHSSPIVLHKNLRFFSKLKYYWLMGVWNSNVIFGRCSLTSSAYLDLSKFFDTITAKWAKIPLFTGYLAEIDVIFIFLFRSRFRLS